MKKYKITYWINGIKRVANTEASNVIEARYYFEMCVANDGIISIEEVK